MILHLGDCVVDADALRREFPHITMVNVPGNCDFSRGDTERLIDIDGYKVLMCHGHTYGVKLSYMHLELHAKEIGADMRLSHHPLIFKPVKHVSDEDFIGRRLKLPGRRL